MPPEPPALGYRFEAFELYPAERRLFAQGKQIALGPRAFDLLVELVDHAGHLLTKNELLERVWPGVIVEENNLQVQISSLRKVLGDAAIETVPGHGYRFTVAVACGEAPSAEAPAPRHHNLPRSLTRFIGHEADLGDYAQALADGRLITLTGVGGCGKTRLAVEMALRLVPRFPDGVWFVDLAPMADAERVPSAVAATLGVKERAGHPILDVLFDHVAERRMLLVLDNCEHLVAACADLTAALLGHTDELKVLATSREALGVPGECIINVRSLTCPPVDAVPDIASISSFEAVRLFVDRARFVNLEFELDLSRVSAVAEICRRLDGIPLALELAAARVRALSVEQIATRLTDRFRLLTSGDRTALPRQQTLRAMIDWSYDLLSERERVLFLRLAVFAGGFTLEAAEAVGSERDTDRSTVLELLAQLVEKSLVVVDNKGARYRLLETVRQYAEQRLDESGEGPTVRSRHLVYFVGYLESAFQGLLGPRQAVWLASLDLERENVLGAHAWCERAEHGAALDFRLVHVMRLHLTMRGLMKLALQLTLEAMARPGAQQRSGARSRACCDAGWIYCTMGRYAEAQAVLEDGLAIARDTGDAQQEAKILQPLGIATLNQGNRTAARAYVEKALAHAHQQGEPREIAEALDALAQVHRGSGDFALAQPLYEQVLVLMRDLGDRGNTGLALLNLAMVAVGRGDLERARTLLRDALAVATETGSKPVGQSVIEVSAGLAVATRAWARGASFYGFAEAQGAQSGISRDPVDEAFLAPLVAKARAELGAPAFAAAEGEGAALSWNDAIAAVRLFLDERR